MTKLELALETVEISRRKASKSSAWSRAEEAARIAGVQNVFQEEDSNYPDLKRLEKDIRATLGTDTIIVTRHAGLVAWLATHGIVGKVIEQATAEDVRGKRVIGALPLRLAAESAEVVVVDLPGLTREQRGQDLTPAEMDAAGATMNVYQVIRR